MVAWLAVELTFIQLAGFVRRWQRLNLTDDDLAALEMEIAREPERSPVVRGTGGLRKIRFAPPSWNTGKSGATRVGFAYFQTHDAIVLVSIFTKHDASNFTREQCADIAALLKEIERHLP